MEFSEVFYTFLITSLIGFVVALAKMAYKSKCKEVSCCCVRIIRDVESEEKEFEFSQTHPKVNNENETGRKIDTGESKHSLL